MMLKHNVTGHTIERFTAQFNFNESLRILKRKDAVSMYHTIISFSNLDKEHLDKKVLTDIAKKYIELQGRDNMYLITHHIEKEHIHFHIAMSGTKFLTGEANRKGKKEFQN
ncbi:MAG: relaxase/mobilization nuclease domain-containing protein [Bacteroidetes bacterium]|nr:relaxase/mobilization nuclease domain-containing protein [Bacteroidota bacterium]